MKLALLDKLNDMATAIGQLLDVEDGWFWLLLGLLGLILEALGTALTLASMGVAAMLTGLFAFCGVHSLIWLLGIFVVISVLLFMSSRPLANRLYSHKLDTNVDALVGRRGNVTQGIGGLEQPGYVKLGGEEWRALPLEELSLPVGSRVVVTRVAGATVYVKRDDTQKMEPVSGEAREKPAVVENEKKEEDLS